MAAVVTKLENDMADNPDSPCPEVQPPAILAPKVRMNPPTNA